MGLTIFIGYVGPEDKKVAKICERRFASCGLHPILSEEVYEDEEVQDKIIAELKEADSFVAVHSSRSLDSAWLHQELGFFLGRRGGRRQGIHILARSSELANDPRSTAFCCTKNYLAISRMKRGDGFSERVRWAKKYQDTLESALDMLVSKMIHDGNLKSKKASNSQFGAHQLFVLHEELPCCGSSRVEVPYRSFHGGWVIKFLRGAACPRCKTQYDLDRLTWEAIPLSPQPRADRFLTEEYRLYQTTLSSRDRKVPDYRKHSLSLANLRNRTLHERGYYTSHQLRPG
jgi:hypothetical protein